MGWAKKILTLISTLNITKLVIKIKWAFPETVRTLIYPLRISIFRNCIASGIPSKLSLQTLEFSSIFFLSSTPGIFFLPPTEIFRNQTYLEFRRPQQGDTDFLWAAM